MSECKIGEEQQMEDDARRTHKQGIGNKQAAVGASDGLRLKSGEVWVFSPDIQSSRVPMVSFGRFRDRQPALHFRVYRRQPDGSYVITNEGASFTVAEWRKIVLAVNDLLEAAPELSDVDPEASK
jgi:hypothetical protein